MSKIRKSTGIGGVAAAALALLLGLTVGSPAYAVPSESSSVAESNQAAIDATLATIDDPAQQEVVRAWMEEATSDGSQIVKAQTGDYTASASGEVRHWRIPAGVDFS